MVRFLNNTDSRNNYGDGTGSMGSVCYLNSSNCNLHMVPSKLQFTFVTNNLGMIIFIFIFFGQLKRRALPIYAKLFQQYYIPTARELARLSGIQQAPILHHFAESLAGAATIRAFDQGNRFVDANLDLIDNFSRPWFHNVSAMEWLSFRLNMLSNFVFAFSLVVLVSLPEGIINPSEYNMYCLYYPFFQ